MIYVKPSGPLPARIAIVGEAPGGDEETQGAPFVGPAGGELTRMLHDGDINRSECFVTNVSRYRPPNNDITQWIYQPRKTDSLPPGFTRFKGMFVKDCVMEHIQHLYTELQACKPNVILALGNTPLWALCGERGISNWRGSILQAEGGFGKVVPTYHPAGVLRQWSWRWPAVQDIRRVKQQSAFPEICHPNWHFTIRPTFQAVMERLSDLLRSCAARPTKLVVDIETRQQQIACAGIAWSALDALCIPIMCLEHVEGYWSLPEELAIIQKLRELFCHPNTRLVGQNFLYDAFYFALLWGMLLRPSMDTMLAQHVCFPGLDKGLDFLASMYCEYYRYWKSEGKEWTKYMAEEALWTYNCQDCVYTWECAERLEGVVDARKKRAQFDFQMNKFLPTLKMMLRGVRTDATQRATVSQELQLAMADRLAWLEKVFGHPVNPRSSDQIKKLLYDDFRLKPTTDRKTGNITANDDALTKCAEQEPILQAPIMWIKEYKSMGVFHSNLVEAPGPRDRFFTSFNIGGTETFRYSSSSNPMGWGTNLQNVPKFEDLEGKKQKFKTLPDLRKLFLPDPGYVLATFDLERADLQVVAWEADDLLMKRWIREGADIHAINANLLRCSRPMGKRFVHLTNYGGTARVAAISCGVSVAAADTMQKRYFAEHPGILAWHERIQSQINSTRTVANKFGFERFYFDRLDGLLKEALAWIPQSTVAIVINTALERIDRELFPDVQLLLQIHDELLMQIRADITHIMLPKIHQLSLVEIPYDDLLIIPTTLKVGKDPNTSWADLKEWPEQLMA